MQKLQAFLVIEEYREKERPKKRRHRERKKAELLKKDFVDKRALSNRKSGDIRKRKYKDGEVKKLKLQVKLFTNENRRLKRRLESSSRFESSSIEDIESTTTSNSEEHDDDSDASTSLISMVSPSSKKRALRRLKLSSPAEHIKRKFRLDKVVVADSTRESELKTKIVNFLNLDENSLVVPDIKKAKKGLRYRLLSLKELHEKFLFCQVFSNDVEDFADSVEIDFLHYTSCCFWEFPTVSDKKIVSSKFVFFGPCMPSETTKKATSLWKMLLPVQNIKI